MNLTFKASLSHMLNRTVQLSGAMKSDLDRAVEYHDTLVALSDIQTKGAQCITFIDELSSAQESLVACGFSDEWFNLLNQDGNFLEAINVKLDDLIGTAEDKGEICMEGLWQTIKEIAKKIWKFVMDLMQKLVRFLDNMNIILKTDISDEKSVQKSIDAVERLCREKHMTDDEICTAIGNYINNARTNGTKVGTSYLGFPVYDRRDLLMRFVADIILADGLTREISKAFLNTNTNNVNKDNEIFKPEVIHYFNQSAQYNYFFYMFDEALRTRPAEVVAQSGGQMFEFNGFKTKIVSKDIRRVGESMGISFNKEELQIAPIDDVLKSIDYAAVYRNLQDYDDVSIAVVQHLMTASGIVTDVKRQLHEFEDIAKMASKFVDDYSKLIEQVNASQQGGGLIPPSDPSLSAGGNGDVRAMLNMQQRLRVGSQWTLAAKQAVARLVTDAEACRSKLSTMKKLIKEAVTEVTKTK